MAGSLGVALSEITDGARTLADQGHESFCQGVTLHATPVSICGILYVSPMSVMEIGSTG